MFSLCQTIRISHQHHHHFQEVLVPSLRTKEQAALRSPRVDPKMGPPHASEPLFRGQGAKVYHSIGGCHQRNRKGIEVVSKQNSKNESGSGLCDASMRHKLHIGSSSSRKQAKTPAFFNQPPCPPQIAGRERCGRGSGEGGGLLADDCNKCDKNKPAKIDPLSTLERSPPSVEIGKQSNQTSLTHFSRHYVHPFAYRFSSKTGQSSNLTFSNQTRDWRPSTRTEQKLREAGAEEGFWSSHERLEPGRRELFGSNNISHNINSAQIASSLSSEQKLTHTLKVGKLCAPKKQLFDAVSIMSRESGEMDENLNIEESILVSRQMDNFVEITQRRQLRDCRLVLALENQLRCLVTLKIYEDHQDQIYHHESLLRLKGEVDHKELSPFLQLYQVLMEGGGLTKRIIFVQQPFERMLDEEISREQLKSDRSAQEQLQNSMLQCVAEVYHTLDHKSIYLAEEMGLDDFVLVNGRIKIHSLAKFKQSEQLQPRELIPQHRTVKHLKKQFSLRMGL